ncbi:MAG TPA: nitrilase-related carbon-nitrogen hydrolase [Armatimonadota bacterium]|nr:nitrilase-related carbon-nitrogen hydrolase [Armatimonadota bacterium]
MEFRVRLAQITPTLGDVEANLERHLEIIGDAESADIDLVVFPEMSLCGYHVRDLAAEVALVDGSPQLGALAAATTKTSAVVGYVAESLSYELHVAAGYFDTGNLLHVHHKIYLPTYGMFDEQRYFANGHHVRAFDARLAPMGMLICEDVWHPSNPYILAHDGAQVIVVIANSPARGPRDGSWDTAEAYEAMLRTYAELFGCYVIFVNRVGYEEGIHFWGGSRVIAPSGAEAARAPLGEEALVDATIDLEQVRLARIATPLLADENLDLTIRELKRIRDERA